MGGGAVSGGGGVRGKRGVQFQVTRAVLGGWGALWALAGALWAQGHFGCRGASGAGALWVVGQFQAVVVRGKRIMPLTVPLWCGGRVGR